jgi:colicin import membrane protein
MSTLADSQLEIDHFKKMIGLSLIFHVTFILIMSLKALFFPSESLDLDSSVRVDLVALPDKVVSLPPTEAKPLPVPAPVSPPPPVPPPQAVTSPAKVLPKPEAIVLKPKISPKDEVLKKIEKFKEQEKRKKVIEEIENQVRADEQKERAQKLELLKSAVIKGNKLNSGTSLKGLNRAAFADYSAVIRNQVHEHWNMPQWLRGASLHTVVHIFIDHRGILIKREVDKSSGDSTFDSYALKAIDESQPFPPPPEKFVDLVQLDGLYLNLNP